MTAAPVNVAVCGAVIACTTRLIGRRHIEHVRSEPQTHLTAVVDPTPAGLAYAEELGVSAYASVEELLQARSDGAVRVDAAILATPNATHVPLSLQLTAGGVHTLVEKPFSTDAISGKELVRAADECDAKLLNPYVTRAKELLDGGRLGQVLAVQGIWATKKPDSYFEAPTEWRKAPGTGGVIMINLSHEIDCLRFLLGDIVRVYCEGGQSTRGFPVDETGACTLRFASGVVGTFIFSDATASPYNFESATGENPLLPATGQTTYTLLGTRGSMAFPDLQPWHYSSQDGCWTDTLTQDAAGAIDTTPPFTLQLRHFVEVVRGQAEPRCSARDGLATVATLEAIIESLRTGKPVDVVLET
ncbi:hypothetical protein JCM8115_005825 [Rhodotorula mucilaginosa]